MIGEYKINRTTRKCHVSDRSLQPGETYYSVVSEHDEEFKRIDIAADAWTGPPEHCIGYWKNRVPRPEEKKRELAPPEVLIELLRSMTEPPQTKMRYLLALMLMRKRHLRPAETATLIRSETDSNDLPIDPDAADDPAARSDATERMELESHLDGSTVSVMVCDIAAGEAESLQTQLIDLLYREVE